jgi:hypothetical protein
VSPPAAKKRVLPRIAAAAGLGLGLVLFVLAQGGGGSSPAPVDAEVAAPPPPKPLDGRFPEGIPPHPNFVTLLDGLAVGQVIEGWEVAHVHPPMEGVIYLEMRKGELSFKVGVGARGTGKPPPPTITDLYEVGYGFAYPTVGAAPDNQVMAVVEDIAARIRKHERGTPKPPGL